MFTRLLLAAVLLGLPALAPAAAASAGAAAASTDHAAASIGDFTFTSFNADYYLGRDADRNATLRTVETLVAEFPDTDQNHGIERAIPTTYGEARLGVDIVSVTDANGTPVHYARSDADDVATLRIGNADKFVNGTQTYVIEYTERNVVRSFEDTKADEFYWNVNGAAWGQPFGTVMARIHLGKGLAEQLTGGTSCYVGPYGTTEVCSIDRDGDVITSTTSGVEPRSTLTFAIGFDRATFADPPLLRNHWAFTFLPWLLLGMIAALLLYVVYLRIFVWRDARGRGTIVAQYAPPKNLHPLLAAELVKRRKSGLPAQIVGFAVNRVVRIREFPDKPKTRRYELQLLQPGNTGSGAEDKILRSLFGTVKTGKTVRLDGNDRRLGDRLAKRQGDEAARVADFGWRARPSTNIPWRVRWIAFGITAAAIVLCFVAVQLDAGSGLLWFLTVFAVLVAIAVAVLVTPPRVLTEEGAEVRDHLLGMRDYIALAEADRIRVLQSPDTAERVDVRDRSAVIKLYEKLLPYAMIWGVEREWIAELEQQYAVTEAPDWYAGTSDLSRIAVFGGVIGAANFATTPSPSSSGGGGSSSGSYSGGSGGGGSAGGGGGGGGGGGW